MKRINHQHALLIVGSLIVGGVVLGMLVGAVSGVLFAPQSGEETREHLRKQADDIGESIRDKGQDILNAGKRQISTALQHGREEVKKAS